MSSNESSWFEYLESEIGHDAAPSSDPEYQTRYQSLTSGLTHGFDADYIDEFENFPGWEHPAIHNIVQLISPEGIRTLSEGWKTLGTLIGGHLETDVARMCAVLTPWEGGVGEEALKATQILQASTTQIMNAFLVVAMKTQTAADASERVKASVPPPAAATAAAFAVSLPDVAADAAANTEQSRQEAIRVMEELYKPYYRDAGSAVPVLPAPHATPSGHDTSSSGSPWGSAVSGDGSASPGTFDASGSVPGTGPSADTNTALGPGTAAAGAENPGPRSSSSSGSGQTATTSPAATTPASTLPGTTGTTGQPYGSTGPLPGSGSSGSGYGSSGGGGGSSALGPGIVGGVGAPATATPTSASSSTTAAARNAGMRPMGMYPGMMPPGQRGSDEARQPSSYLVTNDNGNELIGDLPDSIPPVLGVDPL